MTGWKILELHEEKKGKCPTGKLDSLVSIEYRENECRGRVAQPEILRFASGYTQNDNIMDIVSCGHSVPYSGNMSATEGFSPEKKKSIIADS